MPNQSTSAALNLVSQRGVPPSQATTRKQCKSLAARVARLTSVRDLLDEDTAEAWKALAGFNADRAAHQTVALRIARLTKLRDRADAELEGAWAELALAEGRVES